MAKKKQTGGLLRGKSHDNGGIPAIVAGKKPIEMEGGEFVTSRAATEAIGKDTIAKMNDLGNRDPVTAKKIGKKIGNLMKNGGEVYYDPETGKKTTKKRYERKKKFKQGLKNIPKDAKKMSKKALNKLISKEKIPPSMRMKNGGLTPADKEDLPRVKKKIDKHTASQVHGTGGMKDYEPETDSEKRIMDHLKKKRKKSSEWKPKQLPKGFNPMQMKEGGEIEEIARQMGYGGEIEKYGLGDWLRKKIGGSMSGVDVKGAQTQLRSDVTKRQEDEVASRIQKAKSGDAYLRALSKTSKKRTEGGVPGSLQGAEVGLLEKRPEFFREGGSVMDQGEIADNYAVENYKTGGCLVTGGSTGDPVAIYNNKKR